MSKFWAIILALFSILTTSSSARLFARASGPSIASIFPTAVVAGARGVTITVTGDGFTSSSLVQFNGESLPTTLVDSSTLRCLLPDARLATPALFSVTVFNSDTSTKSAGVLFFSESSSPPSVASITPSAGGLGTTVQVTVSGSNLIGASLNFSGVGLNASRVSGTPTSAVFQLAVSMNAPVGVQNVTVSTISGSAGTCGTGPCVFSVFDAGSWAEVGSMNRARGGAVFVRLLDGRILAAGASNNLQGDATAEIFDPSTGTWNLTAPMNVPRYAAFGALLSDGRVLIGGGNSAGSSLSSVEVFDPGTATWTPAGFISGRGNSAIQLIDGRILISDGEIYNPATAAFSPPQGFASTLGGFLTLLPSGKVLMSNANPMGSNATYIYDPAGATSSGPALNFFFEQIWGRLLPDQRILIRGAHEPVHPGSEGSYNFIGSMMLSGQNPVASGPSTNASTYGADCLLPSGLVFAAGFVRRSITPYPPSLYDPIADRLTPVPPVNADFAGSPVLPLSDGRVLLISDRSTYLYTPGTYSNPVPFISGITSSTPSSSADVITLTIQGNAFLSNSSAMVHGTNLVTIYLGARQLIALAPPSLRSALQTYGVNVLNPGPGGGVTNSVPVAFTATPPTLSGIGPTVLAQGTQTNVVVSGQNLSGATSATVGGTGVTAAIQDGGSLTTLNLRVQVSSTAAVGFRSLTITTPVGSATLNNALQIALALPPSTAPLPISVVETGTIQTGYIVVTPDPGTVTPLATLSYGMVQGGVVLAKGALLPTPPGLQASLPVDVVPVIGRNLGLAIANTSGNSATITVTLRDTSGTRIGPPAVLSLANGQQMAKFLTELLPAGTITTAFQGSALISSSMPVSIIGLNFAAPAFSTVPVSILDSSSGGLSRIVFPQFAQSGGWATTLNLVNTSTSDATGTIALYNASGNPVSISWNGSSSSVVPYSITSNGSAFFAPRDANGQSPF